MVLCCTVTVAGSFLFSLVSVVAAEPSESEFDSSSVSQLPGPPPRLNDCLDDWRSRPAEITILLSKLWRTVASIDFGLGLPRPPPPPLRLFRKKLGPFPRVVVTSME